MPFSHMNAEENIAFGLKIKLDTNVIQEKVIIFKTLI